MHTDDVQRCGPAADVDPADLTGWLSLAEDVARQHRQGRVLGTDPALVLRGLPPVWRSVAAGGAPADDVVSLAGAALTRVDPDDPIRPALVEAAAGCRGSDLPALVREVRAAVDERDPAGHARTDPDGRVADPAAAAPATGDRRRRRRPARPPAATGRRLGLAGAVGAAALAVLGAFGGADAGAPATTLTSRPTEVAVAGGRAAQVSWDPPHLTVELGATRYRYRLDGPVDEVALQPGESGARLVVRAGDERWELELPTPGATGPGATGSG